MLQILKFTHDEKRKVFVTSDLHLNHKQPFIFEKRGYKDVQSHNEAIIKSINDRVNKDDILFSLGDFCLNSSEQDFEGFISSIKCENIYCLWGNHPNPMAKIYRREVDSFIIKNINDPNASHQSYNDKIEIYPFRYKSVVFLGHYAEIIINKQYIVLSHYPIAVHNNLKRFWWQLCGHSHHGFQGSLPSNKYGKILDVGIDGYGKPLTFDEVKEIMDTKSVIKVDDHH